MKTVTTTVYTFSELSEEAKQKAIESYRDINLFYEWWESIYEDAKQIGIKITSFDLDRGSYVNAEYLLPFSSVIDKIKENHGQSCETYKIAVQYEKQYNDLVVKYSDGIDTERVSEGNEYEFDQEADELEKEFINDISSEYLSILQNEYEYLWSDEAVIETIEANEYEFTEDGKPY